MKMTVESRSPATYKMELFVTFAKGWKPSKTVRRVFDLQGSWIPRGRLKISRLVHRTARVSLKVVLNLLYKKSTHKKREIVLNSFK